MKLSTQENLDISSWLTGVNPQDSTNWVKIDSKKFTNAVPTCSFDISTCTKFMIEIKGTASPSGNILAYFDSDTGATYVEQDLYGQGAVAGGGRNTRNGFILGATWGGNYIIKHEFDRTTKVGESIISANSTTGSGVFIQPMGVFYTGTAAMNTLNIGGTNTFTGEIIVYKWQDIKVTNLAIYELIKEYNYTTATVLNDTITGIDWESTPDLYIEYSVSGDGSTSNYLGLQCNGDTTTNYVATGVFNSGASPAAYASNYSNVFIADGFKNVAYGQFNMNLKSGRKHQCVCKHFRENPGASTTELTGGYWSNAAVTTSIRIFSLAAITGSVKVYRLVTKQLLKQNVKPVELVLNKTYSNSAVSESIDVSDCDELEISLIGSSTTQNGFIQFNNDGVSSNYKLTYTAGNGSTISTAVGTGTNNNVVSGVTSSNGQMSTSKITVYPTVKKFNAVLNYDVGAVPQVQMHHHTWYGSGTVNSVQIVVSAGFTGKIKVWKKY
jgi:hypothetical protein